MFFFFGIDHATSLFLSHAWVLCVPQEGVFHFNTFLRLRLTSPHLENGAPHTDHDVLVMRALEDGTRSFAIDDFPAMDPDAVEAFWNRMSDRQREERELAFAELEREGEAELAAADAQARGTWTPERAAAASTADLVTAAHTSGLGAAEEAAVREVLAARMDVEQERARLDGMKTRELRQLARSSAPDVPPEVRALAKVVLEARWQQLERRERDERQRGTASSSASSSASSAAAGRQRAKDEL